jgi:hypothetical protein
MRRPQEGRADAERSDCIDSITIQSRFIFFLFLPFYINQGRNIKYAVDEPAMLPSGNDTVVKRKKVKK